MITVVITIKNEPLLFINSPNVINDEKTHVFDSRYDDIKINKPFVKRLIELSNIYKSGMKIFVEIKLNNGFINGYITDIKEEKLYMLSNSETKEIKIDDVMDVSIIKV